MGRDADAVLAYQEALEAGRVVALVTLGDANFDAVVTVLRTHHATHINYFTSGYMESIPPTSMTRPRETQQHEPVEPER